MKVKLTITGDERLVRLLASDGPAAGRKFGPALFDEANEAFAKSQRVVPVDTGSLRASGHVVPPVYSDTGAVIEIAYGGVAAPYAGIVHEDMEARHDSPTKAKYLEGPVEEQVDGMGERLARAVAEGLS